MPPWLRRISNCENWNHIFFTLLTLAPQPICVIIDLLESLHSHLATKKHMSHRSTFINIWPTIYYTSNSPSCSVNVFPLLNQFVSLKFPTFRYSLCIQSSWKQYFHLLYKHTIIKSRSIVHTYTLCWDGFHVLYIVIKIYLSGRHHISMKMRT